MSASRGTTIKLTPSQLVDALDELDVRVLRGSSGTPVRVAPAELMAALATSDEARLRLALIPLLLKHPEFAGQVGAALRKTAPDAAVTLRCYYTAAFWLQMKHWERLWACLGPVPSLPDLFGEELGLTMHVDPDTALQALAVQQQQLTGRALNWYGTYEHAVRTWLRQLEQQVLWNISPPTKSVHS